MTNHAVFLGTFNIQIILPKVRNRPTVTIQRTTETAQFMVTRHLS